MNRPTCRVIRPDETYHGKQGFDYGAAISAESVGATGLCMHFLEIPPGGRAKATFETPNAPCAAVERYTFDVGACRLAAGFEPQVVCAERMSGGTVIDIVAPAD